MCRSLVFLLVAGFGLTSEAQVVNKAVKFTGLSESKITFNAIPQLKASSQFTFESWLFVEKWNENSYIFKQDNGNKSVSMQLGKDITKSLKFQLGDENEIAKISSTPIKVGVWHHIALVHKTGSKKHNLDFYLDGKLQPVTYESAIKTNTQNRSKTFELASNSFQGKLDEVRIWDKALTASELDYKNTINKRHPLLKNLVAYWKMDDNGTVIFDDKGNNNGTLKDATLVAVNDNSNFNYKIVSSYIRSNFYESNQISEEAILNNNDIIYMAANVSADGGLFHEFPINDGKIFNSTHLKSFQGRDGVIQFNGEGAKVNVGKGLLTRADEGVNTFSFSTWIYVDAWVEKSYIFRKYKDDLNKIDIQHGSSKDHLLKFNLANGSETGVEIKSGIAPGSWHHLAVVYNGSLLNENRLKVYVDGNIKPWNNPTAELPKTAPFFNSDLELGVNFRGKFDETSINQGALTAQEISTNRRGPLVINSWSSSKTVAYWKFDDSKNPGKDSRTWVGVLNGLEETLKSKNGAKLRVGIIQGEWKKMSASDEAISNFATNVKKLVMDYGFDGVDLDFEWCYSPQEWANYSKTIVALGAELPKNSVFSVTLHPLFYQITPEAMAATDFVSIQSYGPSPVRYPYPEFVNNVDAMIKYGYPKGKLVMGLPFYAVTSDNSKVTTSYKTIVNQHASLTPDADEETVLLGGKMLKMTFNGQETIIKKAKLVRDMDLLGVMYWDIATDVDLNNDLSLLKSLNSILNANVVDKPL